VTRANFTTGPTTTQSYQTFFVQDTWKAGNHLTINPGLRYEQEKLAGSIIDDFQLKNNWAPRIGATYDIRGDGRSKVYGNFGRYYSRVPNDLAARALSADDGAQRIDYFDAQLTGRCRTGRHATSPPHASPALPAAGVAPTSSGREAVITDEIVGGVEFSRPTPRSASASCTQYRPRARGRRELPDGGLRVLGGHELFHGTVEHPDQPEQRRRSTRRCWRSRRSSTRCTSTTRPTNTTRSSSLTRRFRIGGRRSAHRYSRFAATSKASTATTTASQIRGSARSTTSRPAIRSIRRSMARRAATSASGTEWRPAARPAAPDQALRKPPFDMGLNIGVGLNFRSGKPLTPGGEPELPTEARFVAARGTGIQTMMASKAVAVREPADFQASYSLNWRRKKVTLLADVFNLFNTRRMPTTITDRNAPGEPNPDSARRPVSRIGPSVPDAAADPLQRADRVLARPRFDRLATVGSFI
jgi:hypothetical protein